MKSALVVEDELIVALDIKRILLKNGFDKVKMCSNAKDAIRKCKEEHFDLVTMDIILRGFKSGIEAAREIRSTSDSKIFFICGNHPSVFSKSFQDYADGFTLKPFMESDLIKMVNASVIA